jgi:hypothetical protein
VVLCNSKSTEFEFLDKIKLSKIIYQDKGFYEHLKQNVGAYYLIDDKQGVILEGDVLRLSNLGTLINDLLASNIKKTQIKDDKIKLLGLSSAIYIDSNQKMIIANALQNKLWVYNKYIDYHNINNDELTFKYVNDSNKFKNQKRFLKVDPFLSKMMQFRVEFILPYKRNNKIMLGYKSCIMPKSLGNGDTNLNIVPTFPLWTINNDGLLKPTFLPDPFINKIRYVYNSENKPFYDTDTKSLWLTFEDSTNNGLVFGYMDSSYKFHYLRYKDSLSTYPKGIHLSNITLTNRLGLYNLYGGYISFKTGKLIYLDYSKIHDQELTEILKLGKFGWGGAIDLGGYTKALMNYLDEKTNIFTHYLIWFENTTGKIIYTKSFKEMKSFISEMPPVLNPYTNNIYSVKIKEGKVIKYTFE